MDKPIITSNPLKPNKITTVSYFNNTNSKISSAKNLRDPAVTFSALFNGGRTLNVLIDDIGRLCFLSHDPEIWINDSPSVFNTEYRIESPIKSRELNRSSTNCITDVEMIVKQLKIARLI
jgi:hypothetical protein